ncbi:MAG TPA: phosphatase PAP2 family protein [Vicinamibacterales bacterium]
MRRGERARPGAVGAIVFTIAIVVAARSASAETRSIFESPLPSPPIGSHVYEGLFRDVPAVAAPSEGPSSWTLSEELQEQEPRKVTRTGFAALVRNIGSDFKAFPRRKSTWVILGIGAGAAAIAYPFDDDVSDWAADQNGLRKALKPGKVLGLGPVQVGAAIGTYLVGRFAYHPAEGRTNKLSHMGFDLLRAQALTQALTYGIKYATQRDRPSGDCCAFPSGHASVTFATASVLERHFGYRAAWPTFVIASYVAAGRLTEQRHFPSDLLFGAALGMASGWTVVGRHGRDDFALMPVPVRGGIALSGTWTPQHRKRDS